MEDDIAEIHALVAEGHEVTRGDPGEFLSAASAQRATASRSDLARFP